MWGYISYGCLIGMKVVCFIPVRFLQHSVVAVSNILILFLIWLKDTSYRKTMSGTYDKASHPSCFGLAW